MSPEAEAIAIVLTAVVHVIGAVVLVWAMFDGDNRPDWRSLWPRDDDGDGGGGSGPDTPDPGRDGGGGPDLLPESRPARVRLRESGRLADAHPRPPRRPAHVPEPARTPERTDG